MATIKQVAALAGVSPMTVSNVVGSRGQVREETRLRVLAAARELNYSLHGPARLLRTGRSRMIGLLLTLANNETLANFVQSVSKETYEAGYLLSVAVHEYDKSLEKAQLAALAEQRVAAVIAFPAGNDGEPYRLLQDAGIPVVFVSHRPPDINADLVMTDMEGATKAAVLHLLERNYRRVALLTPPTEMSASSARVAGYRAAYLEAGLAVPEGLIRHGLLSATDACRAMDDLLSTPVPPDAVVASGSALTRGVLLCLRQRNVAVPRRMAVVGSGELEWGTLTEPPLTATEIDGRQTGHEALRLALSRLEWGDRPAEPREVVLPYRLVIRASSAAGLADGRAVEVS
ncbi:MAG: LacI family transcriptional regulator [Chloroflexi bacterium]|nr:LacI family transcriptional regulator [Chloroflexota bacterium]MCL5110573.1 LacI family transcriptional regulator [Chloroflexota bacterium]